jgi:hypothetical protein
MLTSRRTRNKGKHSARERGGRRGPCLRNVVRRHRRIGLTHCRRGQNGVWILLPSGLIGLTQPRKDAVVGRNRLIRPAEAVPQSDRSIAGKTRPISFPVAFRSRRVPLRVEPCQEYPPTLCGHDSKDLHRGGWSRVWPARSGAFGVARANTMRVSGVSLSVYGCLSDAFRRDRGVGMAYAYGTEPTSRKTGVERDGLRCPHGETSRGSFPT